ncbi:MAG: asparagine synthase (glutamine-hydrolyzing), partial [Chthonomonadales bacterium]
RHRGPDDEGYGICAQAALAMRRLSIIDLAGGHQPIYNEDASLSIVFNGEIYNYRELRRELQAHGHRFTTNTDTEAILHGYEQWGEECVNHFNGMFAFAIWNADTAELFLARDPVGIKPLYLYEDGQRLLFASEIKSILAAGNIPREVDPVALHHYLSFLYVPPPRTMLKSITNLPPGHWARWRNGSLEIREYWAGPQAAFEPEPARPVCPEDVLQMLRDAVRRHLIADVPVGCLLSGGIDSSAIAALMAQEVGPGFKTFTAGFPQAGIYDERPFARAVAQHVGSDHMEVEINPAAAEILPRIVWHLDEPLADASVIPNYLVCQLAASQVKVALSGIGGDEAFGGYRRYFATSLSGMWRRMPPALMRAAISAATRIVPISGDNPMGERLRLARKFYDHIELDPETRYLAWNAFFTEDMKRALYAASRQDGLPDSLQESRKWFRRMPQGDLTRRAMYVDLKTYLPGDPLLLADKLSMAHSLELRVPFLDRELLEFAARIPSHQHLSGKETKSLLRAAVRHLLPPQILERPKRGFGTPIDVWLRMHLRPMMLDLLSERALKARGWFNPSYVSELIRTHLQGSNDYSQHLWALLVFEIWHRQFVDGEGVTDDA